MNDLRSKELHAINTLWIKAHNGYMRAKIERSDLLLATSAFDKLRDTLTAAEARAEQAERERDLLAAHLGVAEEICPRDAIEWEDFCENGRVPQWCDLQLEDRDTSCVGCSGDQTRCWIAWAKREAARRKG